MRSKKMVYTVATLVAMTLFLPFQSHPWALYVGVCGGYTLLVFGLRRIAINSKQKSVNPPLPPAKILMTHSIYLAIVIGWVWLLVVCKPRLPYIFRTEDTSRPYFGLIFVRVFGVLGIEYFEQRHLRSAAENGTPDQTNQPVQ